MGQPTWIKKLLELKNEGESSPEEEDSEQDLWKKNL